MGLWLKATDKPGKLDSIVGFAVFMRFADTDKNEENHQFYPSKPKHASAKNAGNYLWCTEKPASR